MAVATARARDEERLVATLAAHQRGKLRANRHKRSWRESDVEYLIDRLLDEVEELLQAVRDRQSPERIWGEAADVANFAGMIADRAEVTAGA